MTIQKRLFISNILMLCIPAALAVIMLAGGLAVFLFTAFPHAEYELGFPGELLEMRHEVESLALKWLRADAAGQEELEGKLEELAAESRLTLEIEKGQQVVLQIGPGPTGGQSQLEQSLAALHGNGTVSDGSYDLHGKQTEIGGELCQIRLYNPVNILLPWRLQGRMHDKYIMVDYQAYMIGGRNTFDYFIGNYEQENNSLDREVLIYNTKPEQPGSMAKLETYFESVWNSKYCRDFHAI